MEEAQTNSETLASSVTSSWHRITCAVHGWQTKLKQ